MQTASKRASSKLFFALTEFTLPAAPLCLHRGRNQSTARFHSTVDRRQAASVFCLRQRPNEGQTNLWWKSSLFKLKATHTQRLPLGVLGRDGPDANQGFNQALLRAPTAHLLLLSLPPLKSERSPSLCPLSLSLSKASREEVGRTLRGDILLSHLRQTKLRYLPRDWI